MAEEKKTEVFHPTSVAHWREWLQQHHVNQQSVWLVCHTKGSGKKSISWSESVDVALCFGWIDSKKIKIDHETSHQFFSKRKAKSTWSKINKDKIKQLISEGLMTEAGYRTIEIAKQNGSWSILDSVDDLIVPEDLSASLNKNPVAKSFFEGLSKSSKKAMLQWLVLAKRPETRQSRILEIVELANQQLKPKHMS